VRPKSFSILLLSNLLFSLLTWCQDAPAAPPAPSQGGDFAVENPQATKVPAGVILVKGAVPSASDTSTPLPENGKISENIYANQYFGFSYALPANWHEKFTGPPPSDSGYYVLSQIEPIKGVKGAGKGTILVSAQDLFFARTQVNSAREMVNFKTAALTKTGADYKVEREPAEITVSGRTFYRMDYMSPVAEIHWYTLTTQIRCHSVEFMLSSRDPVLLENLVHGIEKLELAKENAPVCIRNYATGDNVVQRVEPVLNDRKFNQIPARIIIDRYGKVKHVHLISAFPEQAKIITDTLMQWEFRPYKKNGEAVEVETGIMFGHAPIPAKTATSMKD
jgi:hypothetical protein